MAAGMSYHPYPPDVHITRTGHTDHIVASGSNYMPSVDADIDWYDWALLAANIVLDLCVIFILIMIREKR